jgi:ApaG protein
MVKELLVKPVLKPGEPYLQFRVFINSPYGAMKGYFNMVNFTTTKNFKVFIPTFKLCAPFSLN